MIPASSYVELEAHRFIWSFFDVRMGIRMAWLQNLEDVAEQYEHLVNAVMMLATVAAVVVALVTTYMAWSEKALKLMFYCDVGSIMHPVGLKGSNAIYRHHHTAVTASLSNRGFIEAKIPYLGFTLSVPKGSAKAILNPATDFRDREPLVLGPGDALSIELRPDDQLVAEIRSVKPKFFPRTRCRMFTIRVTTKNGTVVKAKISKDLRRAVREGTKDLSFWYDETGGRKHGDLQSEAHADVNVEPAA